MRFIVLVKASMDSEAGVLPTAEMLAEMGAFNDQLTKAGIMLAGEGLQPTSKGARIKFASEKPTVIDGPFAETKELVAGFWMLQARSKEEIVEWMSRAPFTEAELEIRQIYELEDFAPVLNAKSK
jgi:hypothetical protein